ncbi:hypothetical protein IF2G_10508 [Cordyceps javanica]|nr:hypothetical protein IF2G_10508 [Cordyceps javanica]
MARDGKLYLRSIDSQGHCRNLPSHLEASWPCCHWSCGKRLEIHTPARLTSNVLSRGNSSPGDVKTN